MITGLIIGFVVGGIFGVLVMAVVKVGAESDKERIPKMDRWRETLKRLVETPPVMGLEINESPVKIQIRKTIGSFEAYCRQQISVHCDPDLLVQTAQKNAELMEMLDEVNRKLETGELVEQKHSQNEHLKRENAYLRLLLREKGVYVIPGIEKAEWNRG